MTFKELHYFLALARVGSYKDAAKACGVTQSTLSLMVQKLERDLGVTLFARDAKQVTLTPIGRRLKSNAASVVEGAGQMRRLAQKFRDDTLKQKTRSGRRSKP